MILVLSGHTLEMLGAILNLSVCNPINRFKWQRSHYQQASKQIETKIYSSQLEHLFTK
jgi:hypothetical protein